MSLINNLFMSVNEKVAADDEKNKKTDHDKQKDTVKSKTAPYLNGVPATADFGNLTKNDVHGLLKSAEEKDDEVETVTFGLETEEGDIVKVYVNVEDADAFEEALSKMLGKEDDIETVLDELSKDYDIVDVKWPDTDVESAESGDENESDEETAAEKLLSKTPAESDDNEDTLDLDIEDKTTTTTKKTTKENQDMNGVGDSFLRRVLGEAAAKSSKPKTKEKEEEEKEIEKNIDDDKDKNSDPINIVITGSALEFQRELSNRYQRLAFQTSYLLGVPLSILTLKRASYKRNLRTVSEQVIDNSQLRIWLKRLANELAKEEIALVSSNNMTEAAKMPDASPVGSKLRDSLQTNIQYEIYDLFVALGVPEDAINQRRSQMRSLIVALGVALQKKQRLRITFRMVLAALGINSTDARTVAESQELVFEDEEQDDLLNLFNSATTYGPWLFLKIATALGIPAALLRSKLNLYKMPLIASFRGKTAAVQKLVAFAELLGIDVEMKKATAQEALVEKKMSSDVVADDTDELDDDEDSKVEVKSIIKKATQSEDLGDWNIGKSGDSILLSIADKKITLDTEQYEKVIGAMADAKATSLLVNNIRVSFRPEHHGKIYVVKWNEPHPTYPTGVLMNKKSINTFLDAGSSK